MKYMTNNLATDEKPTRPNGQSVVLLSAVGGISLGGNMELIIFGACILMIVLFTVVSVGEWLLNIQKEEIETEYYSDKPLDFDKEAI